MVRKSRQSQDVSAGREISLVSPGWGALGVPQLPLLVPCSQGGLEKPSDSGLIPALPCAGSSLAVL